MLVYHSLRLKEKEGRLTVEVGGEIEDRHAGRYAVYGNEWSRNE
jgi:hypothetical protein